MDPPCQASVVQQSILELQVIEGYLIHLILIQIVYLRIGCGSRMYLPTLQPISSTVAPSRTWPSSINNLVLGWQER